MTIQPPMMSSNYTMTRTQRWRPEFRTAPTDLEGIPFSNSGYDPRRDPDRAAKMLKQVKDNVRQLLNHPWNKRQVKWDDKEWKMLEDNSQGYDTQSLMISCGTVTIDRAASGDRRVLLIWNKNTMAVSRIFFSFLHLGRTTGLSREGFYPSRARGEGGINSNKTKQNQTKETKLHGEDREWDIERARESEREPRIGDANRRCRAVAVAQGP